MKKMLSLFIVFMFFTATPIFSSSVPTMDKDELKALLGSENLVILDVRRGKDWSTSEFKIKDAVRVENGELTVAENYPKESTFVLYCA